MNPFKKKITKDSEEDIAKQIKSLSKIIYNTKGSLLSGNVSKEIMGKIASDGYQLQILIDKMTFHHIGEGHLASVYHKFIYLDEGKDIIIHDSSIFLFSEAIIKRRNLDDVFTEIMNDFATHTQVEVDKMLVQIERQKRLG